MERETIQVEPVKIAIIGCGMISNVYIRNLKELFYITEIYALCDINIDSAKEKATLYGIPHVMTMEEIENSKEIEMVVNLTGPDAHYEVIKRMLNAGKHVYTEKTLTADFEQGKELVELAEKKGLYLGASPDTILGAGLQTAKKVLDSGMIGTVTSCVATVNRNQGLNSELFGFIKKSKAAAFPYDIGIYYITALLSLLGAVEKVNGMAALKTVHRQELLFKKQEKDVWEMPGTDLLAGTIQFKNGVIGSVHFNGNSINEEQKLIRIYGTEGILELGDPNTFQGYVKLIRAESGECFIPHMFGYDGSSLEDVLEEKQYGHRGVGVAEMAWAICKKRKNRCSKELALHAMEVLYALEESAKTERTYIMTTKFQITPLKAGYMSTAFHKNIKGDAELSLID